MKRTNLIIIALIVVCLNWGCNLAVPGPYDAKLRALRPGMWLQDVVAALGRPDGTSSGGGLIYRKDGADSILLIEFDGLVISRWAILEVPPGQSGPSFNNFQFYKVKSYRSYSESPAPSP
jgi:hypothetical protein